MTSGDPGWTDNSGTVLRQRVMRAMAQGESDRVEIARALTCSPDEVGEVFAWLTDEGLVAGSSPLRGGDRGPHDAFLNAQGKALVRDWAAQRTPARMKRACTAAMLAWLDAHDGEQIISTEDLAVDARGYFFGEPFTQQTIGQAASVLLDHGLIFGIKTFGPIMARPHITTLGRVVHTQYDGDITAWLGAPSSPSGGDTFHIHNSTGVTVASKSPGASQTVHVTTDVREQVLNLAAALEQMTPALGLTPDDQARAAGLVVQLRQVAEEVETEPGKVSRLLDTVKAVAVNGTGSAAGTALVALVEAIAGSI